MTNDKFIKYLRALRHEDTGTLAAYRRACGQRLTESRGCHDFAAISTSPADFLAVTLAAQYSAAQIEAGRHHTSYPHRGSIGAAWARYCRQRDSEQDPARFYKQRQETLAGGHRPSRPPSIHERFRTLLDAELEIDGTGELAYRLRGMVRMMVAEDVPIDAIQLAWDLRQWRAESRCVQERWARAFYAPPCDASAAAGAKEDEAEGDTEEGTDEQEPDEQEADNDAD